MAEKKPSVPKGTRDFTPKEMVRRNFIFQTIKQTFELFGYQPVETPAMENLTTLLGKYGEEGDKLLFRILNSGDFLSEVERKELENITPSNFSAKICSKGLRYDLTVPFARFVVQHRHEITFPFRRYQIQPVWRADRPQKGRYREFYQCDADVIGSNSLLNEAEFIHIIDKVFTDLDIKVEIRLNNRKVLAGVAEIIGESDRFTDITMAIDKIEKLGKEKVLEELRGKQIGDRSLSLITPILQLAGNNFEKLSALKKCFEESDTGQKGLHEMETVMELAGVIPLKNELIFDITLARGLNYYTGTIFEVKAVEMDIGSICGGGRYDDLTGIFGMQGVSGVGISFGADRIYDVLQHLKKYPTYANTTTKALFVNFGWKESIYALRHLHKLREKGVNSELYPDSVKVKKQLAYADVNQIPFVILAGDEEIEKDMLTLKNMQTGKQETISSVLLTERLLELS